MLGQSTTQLENHPELVLAPGIAIMLTVLAFNVLGDGLNDSIGREIRREMRSFETPESGQVLLRVEDLAIEFITEHGWINVVDGVSFRDRASRDPGAHR